MNNLIRMLLAVLLLSPGAGSALAAVEGASPPIPLSRPGGAWEGLPVTAVELPQEPGWSVRTGFRKGVRDQSLPEEVFAGPDASVLRNGSFAEWTSLLASFHEAFVLVGPDELAATARTKPVLIIPSGGLAGFASSAFFRAGLAEYVRSGGVVLCFAQQKGSDLAALPVPEGSKLEAAGWNEDSGPLFRASTVTAVHPAFADLRRSPPSLETDGYLTTLPKGAEVLLARTDGRPTLAVYPFGRGRIVVTTLFSGSLYGQNLLDEEERLLVRDLVLWAKAGGQPELLLPGARLSVRIPLQGPEHDGSTSVRVFVTAPSRAKPLDLRDFPLAVAPLTDASLPYTYTLPVDIAPGIYHLEYALLDGRKVLTPLVEASAGWFAVLPKTGAPAPSGPAHPLAATDLRISSLPRVERIGNRSRLHIDVRKIAGPDRPVELFARAAGQDVYFRLEQGRGTVAFELPTVSPPKPVSFAIYHAEGRALLKGTAPASLFDETPVVPDRAWYVPGETMTVQVHTPAAGSLVVSGLGAEQEQMTTGTSVLQIPLPQSLPAGVYPLTWTFQTSRGEHKEGSTPIVLRGAEVLCTGATITTQAGGAENRTAVFSFYASNDVVGTLATSLTGPGGSAAPLPDRTIELRKGAQEITVPFPFRPDRAGIWKLAYSVRTSLPEGPGYAREPLTLAAGTVLIDAGNAAILDVRTDPPLTYAPASALQVIAAAAGTAGVKVEVRVDGDRIAKEKIGASGSVLVTESVKDLAKGSHTIAAALSGASLESSRQTRFLSGALLPDLQASIKISGLKAPAIDVGVGITNQGKAASLATQAALYEGDPRSGGTLVRTFPVPPLEPGKQLVVIIPWPLAGKAGRHTLVAAVNEDRSMLESEMENDRADVVVDVPEVLLSVTSTKTEYRADEPVDYRVRIANFSTAPLRSLTAEFQVSEPTGRSRSLGSVALPDVAAGEEQKLDRLLDISAPPEGNYLISARLRSGTKPLADDSRAITVLPTLAVKASLDGTAETAAPCRPLAIQSRAWDAGNVRPSNGTLRLEIRSKALGQLVYALQLPFHLDRRTTRIEKVEFPRGEYTIALRGSVVNKERGLTEELVLDQRPLTVTDAVNVKRSSATFPRVLVWAGGDRATPIEQALLDKMVKEAFAQDPAYLTVVRTASEFTARALTGMFTEFVLIDIDETLDAGEALRNGLERGCGVVIAGSGDRSRAMAETFGFRFEPLSGPGAASITVPAGSALGLTGTLPVSGATLLPELKTATTVASFPDGRPAVLLDTTGRGRIMVLPFSLTRSALNSGISTVYSRLLRETVLATTPKEVVADSAAAETLTVLSAAGPVRTRIVETLPPGATLLWSNVKPSQEGSTLTFELTATADPKTILYLFRPAAGGGRNATSEVFSECGGKFVSQGKVE